MGPRHLQALSTRAGRLICPSEGVDTLEHPGIVYRGPAHDRRAGPVVGPDMLEAVARLRELEDDEEERIATLAEESALHPRWLL